MDLPNLFSANTEKESRVTVIFIHLTSIKTQSFLLSISNDGPEVIESSDLFEYKGINDCLIKVDESLQQLGKMSESVNSAIFGLNNSWVEAGEVIDEKQGLLKKITDGLSLEPLGFIVISEAIIQQEISANSLFSGIVTVFSEKNLIFTLVNQGKVKSVEMVGRSNDSKGDFLEGIARFSTKSEKESFYLPTRIILASLDLEEDEMKTNQQMIYSTDWKKLPQFLQPPTVTILSTDEYELMVTNEAAKAVALQKGMTEAAIAATVDKKVDGKNASKQPTQLDSDESGFSDVSLTPDEVVPVDEATASSFGVPISSDEFDKELLLDKEDERQAKDYEKNSELAIELPSDGAKEIDSDKHSQSKNKSKDKNNDAGKQKKVYKNFKLYILMGFILGLIALLLIGFFGLKVSASTNIDIKLKTLAISKDLEITLDSKISETDIENLVLAANKISKSKSSQSQMQTTGVTIVGEKSSGRVTIYNNTVAEKVLKKGTVLQYEELQFELDSDVTIASASSPKPGVTEHGKADVDVSASQIGADSNLTKDSELSVLPYDKSSYYAYVIDEDFSGGASREVKVVSQEDRTELLVDLRKEIIAAINAEFENESGDGVYILPSNNVVDETYDFNFEVGDEAEELMLTLEVELEALSYTAKDLKPIATEVLASEIPEGYRLSDEDPQILSAPTEDNLDELDILKPVTLLANISSFAIPDLSIDSIKDEISGKKIEEVKNLLESKDEIQSAEIEVAPSIARMIVKNVSKKYEKIIIKFQSD